MFLNTLPLIFFLSCLNCQTLENQHQLFKNKIVYQINKLEEINEPVHEVIFDYNSVTYVRTAKNLHKLNSENKIESTFQSPSVIKGVLVNRKNDIYVFTPQNKEADPIDTLWLIKSSSFTAKSLFSFKKDLDERYETKYCMDKEGDIYFNTENGVFILKNGPSALVRFENLEKFHFNICEEDTMGNVYFIDTALEKDSVIHVTKEAKKSAVPKGIVAPHVRNNISDFKIWNNVPLFVEHPTEKLCNVKMLFREEPKDILFSQFEVRYHFLQKKYKPTGDRFFILEQNNFAIPESNLYFIDKSMNVVHVNQSLLKPKMMEDSSYAVDMEGTAYFAYDTDKVHKVLSLEFDKTDLKEINIPTEHNIYDMVTDLNDKLWILTNELYLLERGSELPVQISQNEELKADNLSFLTVNKKRNHVYIKTSNGFYVVTRKPNLASLL